MRYFEDYPVGERLELGSVVVDEQELLEFARRYDPQPFHVDAEAARQSAFGGLIASGWHTAAMTMRVYVDAFLEDSAGMGASGLEELRWLAPVRPGDELHVAVEVLEAKPSARHPGRGTLTLRTEVTNQDGTTVMTHRARGQFARRPAR